MRFDAFAETVAATADVPVAADGLLRVCPFGSVSELLLLEDQSVTFFACLQLHGFVWIGVDDLVAFLFAFADRRILCFLLLVWWSFLVRGLG